MRDCPLPVVIVVVVVVVEALVVIVVVVMVEVIVVAAVGGSELGLRWLISFTMTKTSRSNRIDKTYMFTVSFPLLMPRSPSAWPRSARIAIVFRRLRDQSMDMFSTSSIAAFFSRSSRCRASSRA